MKHIPRMLAFLLYFCCYMLIGWLAMNVPWKITVPIYVAVTMVAQLWIFWGLQRDGQADSSIIETWTQDSGAWLVPLLWLPLAVIILGNIVGNLINKRMFGTAIENRK